MRDRGIRWSWILYDIGSSGYALLIMAVAFPLYFRTEIANNAPWSDWLWGSLFGFGSILAALVVPIVGAAADISQRGWAYLVFFTGLSVIATMALAIPHLGVPAASLLFLVSLAAYQIAAALYDSVLKFMAGSTHASASGLGWGLGYLGGMACYAVALGSITLTGTGASISSPIPILMTGLYYGLVCGIALYGLAGLRKTRRDVGSDLWKIAFERASARLRAGWNLDRSIRQVIAAGLVTGSAVSIGIFSPLLFASYFGLSAAEVAKLGVIFSLISVPATILAGFAARYYGGRRVILCLLPIWTILVLLLSEGTGHIAALVAAVLLGLILGPTQAVGRSVVAAATERDEAFTTFGFAALVNRTAGALGPLFFGALSSASEYRALPLLVVTSLMMAGYALLALATSEEGQEWPEPSALENSES